MQNKYEFTLNKMEFRVELSKDIVRAIFHTIFFQRALGNVKMNVKKGDILTQTSYMNCNDTKAIKAIDDIIDEIINKDKKMVNSFEIILEFLRDDKKYGFFNLFGYLNQVNEKWILPIKLIYDTNIDLIQLDYVLSENISLILKNCNQNYEHFPQSITGKEREIVQIPFKAIIIYKIILFSFMLNIIFNLIIINYKWFLVKFFILAIIFLILRQFF